MNTTELLAVFRAEVFDTVPLYLWSDELVYGYIDDAQKQFCRDTQGIEDARSFKLSIKADGTQWYAISPLILKLRDAVDAATGLDIPMIAVEKMADHGLRFDGGVGATRALITGMQHGFVRTLPIPNIAKTIELRVFRLPKDIGPGDDFEIDAQHVRNLLYWIKYRAYSVQDAETSDGKQAATNYAAHVAYCAKALIEQSRARRPVSVVTYGGI